MTYLAEEIAAKLEKENESGYNVNKISRAAFRIYQNYGVDISKEMDRKLLALISMEEGPEFEMTEKEFLEIVNEIKVM
ncbi:hypothetical protein [Larsenimonas rhizosphaerae]|uniref:hypothetical protein n=1 Tax=Larsenimonas rhizosphaerae TaxID=2944682 RepID=UPI0020338DF3|nr:hypothetical protein [Larsenimonas rhizosphaerae]MCM2131781.1 hypothetical protein [Larsenimonas rhizosphaerae]